MAGTDVLSRTFESNEVLTPLQIPSRPTVSQDRGLPIEQYYYVTQLKKSDVRMNDELLHKPPDSLAKPLCLPFPTSHPYQTHISRYAMFPNFRSPEDQYTGVEASHHRPLHPNIPAKAFDVVVLRKIKGNPYRHEVVSIPSDSKKEAVHWPGQHTFFHVPKFAQQKGQRYYPKPPKIVAPNSTFEDLGHNLSPRTTNMLRNSERAQWITSYSRDFTGRGPMNPLNLDDYDVKALDRLIQELENVEVKETFLPCLSQVRPLQGRIARLLQGRRPHESVLQEPRVSHVQMPPPLHSVHTILPSYSDTALTKSKATTSPQCKVTENTDQQWDVSPERADLSQIHYQKDGYLDARPPANEFQKVLDTQQAEELYRRQLAERPELESGCPFDYKDLKSRHLGQCRVWNYPHDVLYVPSPPQDVKSEKSKTSMQELWHQDMSQPLWRSEDRPRKTALPECIPSYEVPQHPTTLLELQDSFSKSAAHKRFHDSIKGETKDLRDNIAEGRRHKFYGFNSFYFYN
ncbi:sperm-associated microtubule inner protein 4 [Eudromia elegans]